MTRKTPTPIVLLSFFGKKPDITGLAYFIGQMHTSLYGEFMLRAAPTSIPSNFFVGSDILVEAD